MKTTITIIAAFFAIQSFAQSNLETVVKGGELLLSGLSILKVSNSKAKTDSRIIESICVKNKLAEKITFRISCLNDPENIVKKELVIPKDGKECLLEVNKGIYLYEIIKSNNEIYKKGEYKLEDAVNIVVKDDQP